VKKVSEITDVDILLSCGHSRKEILPLENGHISIENVWTKIGWTLFPVQQDDFRPLRIEY
jgi:hypothetical protein